MQFGLLTPNSGEYFHPLVMAGLAYEAEESGWDGIFMWNHMSVAPLAPDKPFGNGAQSPIVDPWIALAAMAMKTRRIRLGTMITPLPRRRPWKLAREAVSLDHLSNGRLVLGVGIGAPDDAEFSNFGDESSPKVRGEMLDEGLEILAGLWSGEPFSYNGKHYSLKECVFLPKPVQSPRIPVWVAGTWPNKPPFRRAAAWDGCCPDSRWEHPLTPEDIKTIAGYIKKYRTDSRTFDLTVIGGRSKTESKSARIEQSLAFIEAGATWWLQDVGPYYGTQNEVRERIRQGPPRP